MMKLAAIFFFLGLFYCSSALSSLERRLDALESRLDSLEEPLWHVLPKGDLSWERCHLRGPCNCTYLTRTVDCWGALEPQSRIFAQLELPVDVRALVLSKNSGLDAIPAQLFKGLGAIIELSAVDASIASIPKYALSPLRDLMHLNLAGNRLRTLPENVFWLQKAMRTLDLSMNELDS